MKAYVRNLGIAARNSLSKEEVLRLSERITENIKNLDCYKNAKNVMIYKSIKNEVNLCSLENDSEKIFWYPLCLENYQMAALKPSTPEGWQSGAFGIMEPVPSMSEKISPEDIDLVICPCTAFDENLNRCGMGGGYYDRFLAKCINATIIAVAFQCQKMPQVPVESWDIKIDMVMTE